METRFALYGEWKDTLYRRIPALQVRKAEAERDIKSLLRRLSTENVKQLGKTIAKVAHTNPTIIFGVVLNQVQSYDNLIRPVVEAARYYTEFGYDVFAYSLLDALSSGKSKTKEDGTSVALWLQGELLSLSLFSVSFSARGALIPSVGRHRPRNLRRRALQTLVSHVLLPLDPPPIPRQPTRLGQLERPHHPPRAHRTNDGH